MRGDPLYLSGLQDRIGPVCAPAFDLIETPDRYTLLGDLPGLGLRDLDIELTGNQLTVAGEREPARIAHRSSCHALERTFGSFCRTFHLPARGMGKCTARMKQGVLTVTILKQHA